LPPCPIAIHQFVIRKRAQTLHWLQCFLVLHFRECFGCGRADCSAPEAWHATWLHVYKGAGNLHIRNLHIRNLHIHMRARAGGRAGAGGRARVCVCVQARARAGYIFGPKPGLGAGMIPISKPMGGLGKNGSHSQGQGQLLRNNQIRGRMVASPFAGCIVC
jgi:hypothetical protein